MSASLASEAQGSFELAAGTSGQLRARGALTFATARAAREAGLTSLASSSGALELDCGGITAADSAGLAVLVDWLGRARQAGRALRYLHLPEGLTTLARISDLQQL